MKQGVDTYFLDLFDFEERLHFAKDHGVRAVEVALLGEDRRKYCVMDKLMAEDHACLTCVEPQTGELVHSPPSLMRLHETIGSSHSNSLSLRERRCP